MNYFFDMIKHITFFLLVLAALNIQACSDNKNSNIVSDAEGVNALKAQKYSLELPLIDGVPLHRKNGVYVHYALNYNPQIRFLNTENGVKQDGLHLELTEPRSALAWLLRDPVNADFDGYMHLTKQAPETAMIGFIMKTDGSATFFTPPSKTGFCKEFATVFDVYEKYNVTDKVPGLVSGKKPQCKPMLSFGTTGAWAPVNAKNKSNIKAIGILFDGKAGDKIEFERAGLFTAQTDRPESRKVLVSGNIDALDLNITPAAKIHLRYGDGNVKVIKADSDGTFSLPKSLTKNRLFQIWYDYNGEQHFTTIGAWLDPELAPDQLSINVRPEFILEPSNLEAAREKTSSIGRSRKPHAYSIHVGNGPGLRVQEFQGESFINNLKYFDRDRFESNPNDCFRAVHFGGSYIMAAQTTIAQKPGLITEAILEAKLSKCVEVFSIGTTTRRIENYIFQAPEMAKLYDLDLVIFAFTGKEICEMSDAFYEYRNGVSANTPTRPRIIDGAPRNLVSRSAAKSIKKNKDFDLNAICDFSDTVGSDLETHLINKIKVMKDTISAANPKTKTMLFNSREPMTLFGGDKPNKQQKIEAFKSQAISAKNMDAMCQTLDIYCNTPPNPKQWYLGEELNSNNPFLYRYIHDFHPNVRANQYIGEHLALSLEPIVREHFGQ